MRSVIVGTGSHIPSHAVPNDHFLHHEFRGPDREHTLYIWTLKEKK